MAKKRNGNPEDRKTQEAKSVSRRNFLTHGAVAGVSAAALGGSVAETSAQGNGAEPSSGTTRRTFSSSVPALPACPAPSGRATPACGCS